MGLIPRPGRGRAPGGMDRTARARTGAAQKMQTKTPRTNIRC